jgi:hypothetical protein
MIIDSRTLIKEGEGLMSQIDERERGKKYRIDIGAYGSIGIEAPTKEECLELFKEVTRTRRDSKLDEAIR